MTTTHKYPELRDWDQLRENFRARGSHYFDRDTMRFFASRLIGQPEQSENGRFAVFVTSEKRCFDDPTRTYNVRTYDVESGHVDTAGGFCECLSRSTAIRRQARILAAYNALPEHPASVRAWAESL